MLWLHCLWLLSALPSVIGQATCTCDTPKQGTAGYNRMTCTDGYSGYCMATDACVLTSPFPADQKGAACRAPTQVTIGNNPNGQYGLGYRCVTKPWSDNSFICSASAGDPANRIPAGDGNPDTFMISANGYQLCASRTDSNPGSTGWGLNLVVQCYASPPPTNTFTVAAGDACTVDDSGCVMSPGYPNSYPTSQSCNIGYSGIPTELQVVAFNTEDSYDIVTLNGVSYSGSGAGLDGQPSGNFTWSSDIDQPASGWRICPGAVLTTTTLTTTETSTTTSSESTTTNSTQTTTTTSESTTTSSTETTTTTSESTTTTGTATTTTRTTVSTTTVTNTSTVTTLGMTTSTGTTSTETRNPTSATSPQTTIPLLTVSAAITNSTTRSNAWLEAIHNESGTLADSLQSFFNETTDPGALVQGIASLLSLGQALSPEVTSSLLDGLLLAQSLPGGRSPAGVVNQMAAMDTILSRSGSLDASTAQRAADGLFGAFNAVQGASSDGAISGLSSTQAQTFVNVIGHLQPALGTAQPSATRAVAYVVEGVGLLVTRQLLSGPLSASQPAPVITVRAPGVQVTATAIVPGGDNSALSSVLPMTALPPMLPGLLSRRLGGSGNAVGASSSRMTANLYGPASVECPAGQTCSNVSSAQGDIVTLSLSSSNGSELEVKNLTVPFVLVVPINQGPSDYDAFEQAMLAGGPLPACRFWNDVNKEWSSEGCRLLAVNDNGSQLLCACTHLTPFGAFGALLGGFFSSLIFDLLDSLITCANVDEVFSLQGLTAMTQNRWRARDSGIALWTMLAVMSAYFFLTVGLDVHRIYDKDQRGLKKDLLVEDEEEAEENEEEIDDELGGEKAEEEVAEAEEPTRCGCRRSRLLWLRDVILDCTYNLLWSVMKVCFRKMGDWAQDVIAALWHNREWRRGQAAEVVMLLSAFRFGLDRAAMDELLAEEVEALKDRLRRRERKISHSKSLGVCTHASEGGQSSLHQSKSSLDSAVEIKPDGAIASILYEAELLKSCSLRLLLLLPVKFLVIAWAQNPFRGPIAHSMTSYCSSKVAVLFPVFLGGLIMNSLFYSTAIGAATFNSDPLCSSPSDWQQIVQVWIVSLATTIVLIIPTEMLNYLELPKHAMKLHSMPTWKVALKVIGFSKVSIGLAAFFYLYLAAFLANLADGASTDYLTTVAVPTLLTFFFMDTARAMTFQLFVGLPVLKFDSNALEGLDLPHFHESGQPCYKDHEGEECTKADATDEATLNRMPEENEVESNCENPDVHKRMHGLHFPSQASASIGYSFRSVTVAVHEELGLHDARVGPTIGEVQV